jgi:ABC-type transport system involved in multi-copper enzyme maturation permease subunit
LRSLRFRWLLTKEFRDLLASRAFWLLLLMVGPLVGHAFITAVETYAEARGRGGGVAALAQGLSPLDGILAPTFGAYDLAVTLLFPFVAIRLISAERDSGAWKLMLQAPVSLASMLTAKAIALLAGWLVAWIPGLLSLALWKIYGGALYPPEVLNLLLGHLLRVILASGVAVAAAAVANNAASAAIAALGFTIGTWAIEFMAEIHGGLAQEIADYTPTSALRAFEHGQLRLRTLLITLLLGLAGFALSAVWLPTGRTVRRRLALTAAAIIAAADGAITIDVTKDKPARSPRTFCPSWVTGR